MGLCCDILSAFALLMIDHLRQMADHAACCLAAGRLCGGKAAAQQHAGGSVAVIKFEVQMYIVAEATYLVDVQARHPCQAIVTLTHL